MPQDKWSKYVVADSTKAKWAKYSQVAEEQQPTVEETVSPRTQQISPERPSPISAPLRLLGAGAGRFYEPQQMATVGGSTPGSQFVRQLGRQPIFGGGQFQKGDFLGGGANVLNALLQTAALPFTKTEELVREIPYVGKPIADVATAPFQLASQLSDVVVEKGIDPMLKILGIPDLPVTPEAQMALTDLRRGVSQFAVPLAVPKFGKRVPKPYEFRDIPKATPEQMASVPDLAQTKTLEAPLSEAPVSRGGSMDVRGPANQAQIDQFYKAGKFTEEQAQKFGVSPELLKGQQKPVEGLPIFEKPKAELTQESFGVGKPPFIPPSPKQTLMAELPPTYEPKVKETIINDLTKAAVESLKDQPKSPERIFRQIQGLIENQEIALDSVRPMLEKMGMSEVEFAGEYARTVSGSGRILAYHSRTVRQLARIFEGNKEAVAVLDKFTKEHPPGTYEWVADVYRKIDNVRRASLVSQLATAVRNASSQGIRSTVEVFDTFLSTLGNRGIKEASKAAMEEVHAIGRALKPGEIARVEKLLEDYPIEGARLFTSAVHEVPALNKYGKMINVFNNAQEMFFRRLNFEMRLAADLQKKGMDYRRIDPKKIPEDAIRDAVDASLENTFSHTPKGGLAKAILNTYREIPFLTLINPFPRFSYGNAMRFLYEFSPLGMTQLFSKSAREAMARGDSRVLSRAVIGTGMLATAMAVRASENAGEKWYEVKVAGKTLDTRPFAPFSTYLFLAEALMRPQNVGVSDVALMTVGLNRIAGTGLVVADWVRSGMTAQTMWENLQEIAGQYAGGFTVPLKTLKDISAGAGQELELGGMAGKENVVRSTKENPLVGPTLKNIPGASQILPPSYSPYFGGEIRDRSTLLRQFTGLSERDKGELEKESTRLNLRFEQIYPKTGVPIADRIIIKNMGQIADVKPLPMNQEDYKNLSIQEKRIRLRSWFSQNRALAKQQLAFQYPELFREIRLRGIDPDIIQMRGLR